MSTDSDHSTIMAWQHLNARNDRNGNPRRVFVVYAQDGSILDAIDEGYTGTPRWLRDFPQLPGFVITYSEYRELLTHAATPVGA